MLIYFIIKHLTSPSSNRFILILLTPHHISTHVNNILISTRFGTSTTHDVDNNTQCLQHSIMMISTIDDIFHIFHHLTNFSQIYIIQYCLQYNESNNSIMIYNAIYLRGNQLFDNYSRILNMFEGRQLFDDQMIMFEGSKHV